MATGYNQLTAHDCNLGQHGLNAGTNCRQIAQRLGRCPSPVTRAGACPEQLDGDLRRGERES